MNCEYCEIAGRKEQVLYDDEDVLAVIKDVVMLPGQITVIPKKHFTIMELVPDEIIEKCFSLANKISAAVFEGFEAQGTNIIVQNGLAAGQKVPHFAVEVIPRREEDDLKLSWQPKQMMEDEIDLVHSLLKAEAGKIDLTKKPEEKKEAKEGAKEEKAGRRKEDYQVKSLRRLP